MKKKAISGYLPSVVIFFATSHLGCAIKSPTEFVRGPLPAQTTHGDMQVCRDVDMIIRPIKVDIEWRHRDPLRDPMVFVSSKTGPILLLSDVTGDWEIVDLYAVPVVRRRGAVRNPPHYGLDLVAGERWVFTTSVLDNGSSRIVLGSLQEPKFLTEIETGPGSDVEPEIVARPGGGWAVAWIRGDYPRSMKIQFALVEADGETYSVHEIETASVITRLHLENTSDGFALVHGYLDEQQNGLALRLLDSSGVPSPPVTIARGENADDPMITKGPGGLAVVFREGLARLQLVTYSIDGAITSGPQLIMQRADKPTRVEPSALLYHRGRYWIGVRVSHCGRERCVSPHEVHLASFTPDGRPARQFELARGDRLNDDLVLGRSDNGVIAAWSTGLWNRRQRLHVVETNCSITRDNS